mmetsp:Transcript_10718/g.21538  ORF Transcript_10718/g.21538 Transcript_10718/m.21538 type:complete len:568 (-) Transcript_10718:1041-2744(-)
MFESLYLGIDVGTSSARAGLFDCAGRCHGTGSSEFPTSHPEEDFYEQSSDKIWDAVCAAVARAFNSVRDHTSSDSSGDDVAKRVVGIGFDATCSLVALGDDNQPVSVSKSGNDDWNIIVWMDHRAKEEADWINSQASVSDEVHRILKHYGGRISLENEPPKLLWVKKNLPDTWNRTKKWMDLSDFLTFKATGNDIRSSCSTACKWARVDPESWSNRFWTDIGMEDLVDDGTFKKIGSQIGKPGEMIHSGLTKDASLKLGGLRLETAVAVSAVDAHAGGIGLMGATCHELGDAVQQRLALICGTSTCHMAVSTERLFVPRIWGPFKDAMVPGMWLTEGGQTATGSLLDSILQRSRHFDEIRRDSESRCLSPHSILCEKYQELCEQFDPRVIESHPTYSLHVLPYFHGNRHPRADPSLMGVISGLGLSDTIDDLARLYGATLESLVYGARHIIETLNTAGHDIRSLFVCGGIAKSEIFLSILADASGLPVVLSKEPEAVLLGSSILAATAAGRFADLTEAMLAMSSVGRLIHPQQSNREFHERKYRVFLRMYQHFMEIRQIMSGDASFE